MKFSLSSVSFSFLRSSIRGWTALTGGGGGGNTDFWPHSFHATPILLMLKYRIQGGTVTRCPPRAAYAIIVIQNEIRAHDQVGRHGYFPPRPWLLHAVATDCLLLGHRMRSSYQTRIALNSGVVRLECQLVIASRLYIRFSGSIHKSSLAVVVPMTCGYVRWCDCLVSI